MSPAKAIPATAAVLAVLCSCSGPKKQAAIEADPAIETAIKKTLAKMTIEEKAGQMWQITLNRLTDWETDQIDPVRLDRIIGQYKVGSILNVSKEARTPEEFGEIVSAIQKKSMETMGIPCVYGLDMIHGASYYIGSTLFPQEINIAATFNTEYAKAMGEAIGYETRAGMVPWVFSPVMDLTRNACWPRVWESWGEDPFLQAKMAVAETVGAQGDDPNHIDKNHVAVSIKHYMGYGAPATGKDRTPAYIAECDLREKYFRPFKESAQAGALTVMVNSSPINGIPTHANKTLISGWLKEDLEWDGMVVTDWADIDNFYTRDHIATDKKDAIRIGINAGIDMVMDPMDETGIDLLVELIKEGAIPMARIDDAVSRVLRLKYRLGLFDNPTWDISKEAYPDYASDRFVAQSKKAAVESMVLLANNNNTLPLKKGAKIFVTGPNAVSVRTLNGGWSYTWQGSEDPKYVGDYRTILDGLKAKFGASKVAYIPTIEYVADYGEWQKEKQYPTHLALSAARNADVIICCIGENTYCETPGNINDLNISKNQYNMVRAMMGLGKPVILVLNEGRGRVLGDIATDAAAVVDIMLPGNYGADALAALLAGEENFSGKLPFTYPKYPNSIHTYDYKVTEFREVMDGDYNYDAVMDVQWPFGAGLSYTTFEYSNLKADRTEFKDGDILTFTVDVQNTGNRQGKESVLLFSSDLVASIIPDVKRLRAFDKVDLAPGQKTTVTLQVPAKELAFVGADGKWRLEKGEFRIGVGGLGIKITCTETKVWEDPNQQF